MQRIPLAAVLVLVFICLVSACTSQVPEPSSAATDGTSPVTADPDLPVAPVTSPPQPTPQIVSPETPRATTGEVGPSGEAQTMPRPQYTIHAELDYARHFLAVEERILYHNPAGKGLNELLLVIEPVYYPAVFKLVHLATGEGTPLDKTTWDGSHLKVVLPETLPPGEAIEIDVQYELDLPSPTPSTELRPVPFGYTARQINLVDWYPIIPPYVQGEGWLAHKAGFFGEHQVYEVADFLVNLRILDEREDLVIAASAPEEIDGEWHRYTLEAARNFSFSVSHQYQVLKETIGETTVIGYAFPYHAQAGERAFQTTVQALRLFQEIYGPYTHKTLSVVEADFLDGMEYEGLYFLSNGFYNLYQGTPAEYLTSIAAHETAHQWWYALVGNDQALEPWLDEALCTYSELVFYENLYPEAVDWWWTYRVQYYEPRGWVNGSIYNPEGYRAYRDAVYLNGAVFLHNLRTQIGDEAFFSFLRDYGVQKAHQIASAQDFFGILAQHTKEDLTPLIQQFFKQ